MPPTITRNPERETFVLSRGILSAEDSAKAWADSRVQRSDVSCIDPRKKRERGGREAYSLNPVSFVRVKRQKAQNSSKGVVIDHPGLENGIISIGVYSTHATFKNLTVQDPNAFRLMKSLSVSTVTVAVWKPTLLSWYVVDSPAIVRASGTDVAWPVRPPEPSYGDSKREQHVPLTNTTFGADDASLRWHVWGGWVGGGERIMMQIIRFGLKWSQARVTFWMAWGARQRLSPKEANVVRNSGLVYLQHFIIYEGWMPYNK